MGTSRTSLWKESWNKLNMLNGNLGNLWTLCTWIQWIQWILNMIWVWTAADLWRHHFIQGTSRSQRSWRRIHLFVEDFSNVSWKPRIFPLELLWNFWIGAAAQSMWNWSLVVGKSRISGGLKWASNDSETSWRSGTKFSCQSCRGTCNPDIFRAFLSFLSSADFLKVSRLAFGRLWPVASPGGDTERCLYALPSDEGGGHGRALDLEARCYPVLSQP